MGKIIGIGNAIGIRKGSRLNLLPPTDLIVFAVTDTSVRIEWTNSISATTGYKIERSTDGFNYVEVGTVDSGDGFFIDTVTSDTLYYYRIRAYKGTSYSDYTSTVALEYGPEIVQNTSFDTDTWWNKQAGITIQDGVARFTSVASELSLSKTSVLQVGSTHRIIFTIKNYVSGQVSANVGASSTAYRRSGNGTYELLITAINQSIYFSSASGPSTYDLDDISIKKKYSTP